MSLTEGTSLNDRPPPCGLTSCLAICLSDIDVRSRRPAFFLRVAITRLQPGFPIVPPSHGGFAERRQAVASFLSFLLPEIEAKNPQAARAVRAALRSLERPAVLPVRTARATLH